MSALHPIDADHPPHHVVRDCLFAFEVLRRLGFPSEEIFVGCRNVIGVGASACVVLRRDETEWSWIIEPLPGPMLPSEFQAIFEAAAEAWNAFPPDTDPWGYARSPYSARAAEVTISLVRKGITMPRLGSEMAS